MKLIFEFARIAAFCFAGEVCHLVLPLPIPALFVPAAAGVMDLWADLQAMLVPVLLALIPITILVMTVSGCVTQRLAERKEKKQ